MLASLPLVAALLAGCDSLPFRLPVDGVIQPRIVPVSSEAGNREVERTVTFDDGTIMVTVPVDNAVYRGASEARKDAIVFGDREPADWVPDYYRAFVDEPRQEAFYAAITQALGQARDKANLDDDRYFELVVAMAQQMEYRTDPGDLAPKFPIETFGDGFGDCDDKTLLTAGILAREGYDVAMLVFGPEKHVALGVKSPGLDYAGTGYAFVETTNDALPGMVPDELAGGIKLTSDPQVIRIGDGTKVYSAGEQVAYIEKRLDEMDGVAAQLKPKIDTEKKRVDASAAALEAELAAIRTITDPATANARIAAYNADVDAYYRSIASLQALVDRYNAIVDAQKFVAEHQMDRPAIYQRLRSLEL